MAVPSTKMTYRFLGDSGLLVSRLSLGGWMDIRPEYSGDKWYEIMKVAFAGGVNLFDTAEIYGSGLSEQHFGYAIAKGIADGVWTREDLVVSTKLFCGSKGFNQGGPNDQGLSRKHLVEGVKASLKRLRLDYVDVLFCHRPEPYTPIEETVRAMNFIINQGWAFYWGTSEWTSADFKEACDIADRLGLIRPIVEQAEYNIFERSKVEFQYADLYKKYKLGLTTWSPLCSGVLTGKYSNGVPADSRLDGPQRSWVSEMEEKIVKTKGLEVIAKRLGCSLAQLAIAWAAANEHVSTVLLGARTAAQLEETIASFAFVDKITPEVKAEIDAIVPFVPKLPSKELGFVVLQRQRWL